MNERGVERDITTEEHAFVERLLDEVGSDGAVFRPQLVGARVVQECVCGCPSIVFVAATGESPARAVAILDGISAMTHDGHNVGVVLLTRGDWIFEVEIVGSPKLGTYPLPAAETIRKNEGVPGPRPSRRPRKPA